MVDFFVDILDFAYLRNALWASVLTGIICGIVGTYIVARRSLLLAGGITHSSFGGLGVALYLGVNPIFGALVSAIVAAFSAEWASSKGKIREDSAISIVWALGMATGVLFMSLRSGYTSGDLSSYLFGSIVTVSSFDVCMLTLFCLVLLGGCALHLRKIMLSAFDRDFARSQGIKTTVIAYSMAAIIACAIVLSIRTMGIVLLLSQLTLPVTIADSVFRSYRQIIVAAPIIGCLGNLIGLFLSYKYEIPPSASIIFLLAITLIIIKVFTLKTKLI